MYSSTTPLLKPTAPSVATVHLAPSAHLAPYVLGEKETRHVSPALLVHIVLIAVHVRTVLVDISLFLHQGCLSTGLHKLWYPGIRDRSTWGKFGAHGEHGDVFLFSNLGAL